MSTENDNKENGNLPISDVIDFSYFSDEKAIYYLEKKLFGSHSVIKELIFEAVYLIKDSKYETQKVLEWFNSVEMAFKRKI